MSRDRGAGGGLAATLAVSVLVALGLAWLAMRPGSELKPVRSATFELDEPVLSGAPNL